MKKFELGMKEQNQLNLLADKAIVPESAGTS